MADPRVVTVKTSGGTYQTLSAALSTETKDLVTANRQLTIELYEDVTETTTGLSINGWTTSADCYLKIVGASTARHGGLFSTSAYTLAPSGSGGVCLTISDPYVWVDGLRIDCGSNWYGVYVYYSGSPVWVSNLLVKNGVAFRCGAQSGAVTVKAWNLIAYDYASGFAVEGGDANTTLYLSNATLADVNGGVQVNGGTLYGRNIAVKSTAESFYRYSGTMDLDWCASSDARADDYGGTHNQVNVSDFKFSNAADHNFLFADDSPMLGQGTNLESDANYRPVDPKNDDITGGFRPAGWSIGADDGTAQFGRPSSDISDGNWKNQADSNVNLYESINETAALLSDADYIQSGTSPVDDTCVLGITGITDPGPGTVIIRIRTRFL